MLACPRCQHSLSTQNHNGVEIDTCNNCGGVMFDNYELVQVIKGNIDSIDSGTPMAIERKSIAMRPNSGLNCPRCSKPMREFNYGYGEKGEYFSSDIVINSCLDCRTIWLDKGELNAIKMARGIAFEIGDKQSLPPAQRESLQNQAQQKYCPNCKEIELEIINKKGVEIDYCPKCFGIWFDKGELNDFLSKSLQEGKTKIDKQETVLDESDRKCPVCRLPLCKHNYHFNIPVQIDSCMNCNGMWLDRGEFDKIKMGLDNQSSVIQSINKLGDVSKDIWKI
ncbi:MAG: zf-TFIIB domain-containing protein [Candidatus Margulisiibacteriota bacterium]